jgi:hypothetical protein
MTTLPYDIMQAGIDYNGVVFLQDRYAGDTSFFVSIAPEYIAAMLIRLGKPCYISTARTTQTGKYITSAETIANEVEAAFTKMFAGKRGRKPNVAFYVVDGETGEVLRIVKP